METYFLTVANVGPRAVVVPRRLTLRLASGSGRLEFSASPPIDAEWRSSIVGAWDFVLNITGRKDVDGSIGLVGTSPLSGGSAGLSFGLLAVAMLTKSELPPHFATGCVDGSGFLSGGAAAEPKARAAAQLSRQLGRDTSAFLLPPMHPVPRVAGVSFVTAADVGDAFARLHPTAYRIIEDRHRQLRSARDVRDLAALDVVRPFALLGNWPGAVLPAAPEGFQIARTRDERGPWVAVGERDVLLWRTSLDVEAPLWPQVQRAFDLGRRSTRL